MAPAYREPSLLVHSDTDAFDRILEKTCGITDQDDKNLRAAITASADEYRHQITEFGHEVDATALALPLSGNL